MNEQINEKKMVKNWFEALELKHQVENWIVYKYEKLTTYIFKTLGHTMYGFNKNTYHHQAILDNTAIKLNGGLYQLEYGLFMIFPTTSVSKVLLWDFLNINYPNLEYTGLGFKRNNFSEDYTDKYIIFYFTEQIF